jgi:hypothetical protein
MVTPPTNVDATSSTKPSRKKRTPKKVEEEMTIVNPQNPNEREIMLGGDFIDIKTSTVVKLHERLVVQYDNGPIELIVEITADFNTIPQKYHEIFLNVISSKYLGKVSFGDNPFSECRPIQKSKWYQFWKSKYFN